MRLNALYRKIVFPTSTVITNGGRPPAISPARRLRALEAEQVAEFEQEELVV